MNPVYDTAYYEDLAGRLYGLVIRLDDRLSSDQAQWLHHVTEVGEYGLALDDMAAILAHGKIAITDQERRDLLALAEQMKAEGAAARCCPALKTPMRAALTVPMWGCLKPRGRVAAGLSVVMVPVIVGVVPVVRCR